MTSPADLAAAEKALQAAIRVGDVPAIERLLDERFVHVGPDGSPQDKSTILMARASGAMLIRRLEGEALDVVVERDTGITRATLSLTGISSGAMYSCRLVVTRTWSRCDGGWTVLGEHVSLVEPREPMSVIGLRGG